MVSVLCIHWRDISKKAIQCNSDTSTYEFFLKKWAYTGLFFIYFCLFQTHITIFTTNKCEKCPCSNSQPLEHESLPLTTGPGLPHTTYEVRQCSLSDRTSTVLTDHALLKRSAFVFFSWYHVHHRHLDKLSNDLREWERRGCKSAVQDCCPLLQRLVHYRPGGRHSLRSSTLRLRHRRGRYLWHTLHGLRNCVRSLWRKFSLTATRLLNLV